MGLSIFAGLLLFLLVSLAEAAPEVYRYAMPVPGQVYVAKATYPPPGRGYCDISTNVAAYVIPGMKAGEVLDVTGSLQMQYYSFGYPALAAAAVLILPWNGIWEAPLNSALPCTEAWTPEDVNASRPYYMPEMRQTYVATAADEAHGTIVILRAFGYSELGPGWLSAYGVRLMILRHRIP